LISKFLVGRKTSKVVENADESGFGEGQETYIPRHSKNRISERQMIPGQEQIVKGPAILNLN